MVGEVDEDSVLGSAPDEPAAGAQDRRSILACGSPLRHSMQLMLHRLQAKTRRPYSAATSSGCRAILEGIMLYMSHDRRTAPLLHAQRGRQNADIAEDDASNVCLKGMHCGISLSAQLVGRTSPPRKTARKFSAETALPV